MARAKHTISIARNLGLTLTAALAVSACSTVQENPNYQFSTKYKGPADTSYAANTDATATTTAATYTQAYQGQGYPSASTVSTAEQECRRKEGNREIIGGAAGGTIGAIAGKKLIGGTAGTVVGAVLGGAAGYGLGDISVDCSPAQNYQPAPAQAYNTAPTGTAAVQAEPIPYGAQPALEQALTGQPVTAPTDTQYADQSVTGTPGYEVLQAQQAEPLGSGAINPTTVTISGPVHSASTEVSQDAAVQNITNGAVEVTDYDYSANLIVADIPVDTANILPNETRILNSQNTDVQNSAVQTIGAQSYRVQPGDTVYGLSRKLCVSVVDIQQQNNINETYGINIGQVIQLPQNQC